jgi:hypothetical protein
LFYGRRIARWWDLVAGIEQEFDPGPARTWAAFGIQGLAPYRFEIELTGYVDAEGRTHVRTEVEYELLLTNRLVLQPQLEMELFGKSDPERGIGAGLSTTDIGFRPRYEFKREFAPYIGVVWSSKWVRPPISPKRPARMLVALDSWQDCDSGSNGSRQNAIDAHSNAAFIEVAATPSGNEAGRETTSRT